MTRAKHKFRFTDESVRSVESPDAGYRLDYDNGNIRGFALQTSYSGTKRFLLTYTARDDGRNRRMVLGEFGPAPKLSVSAARIIARKYRGQVDNGLDPWKQTKEARVQAEAKRKRKGTALRDLLNAYVEHLKARGKSSWKAVESSFERHLLNDRTLANRAADETEAHHITDALRALTKAGKYREAEKVASYVRAAYKAATLARHDAAMHAFEGFNITGAPMAYLRVSRPEESAEKAAKVAQERKWALSQPQLAAYWRRINAMDDAVGALLRFHLLTGGQRVEQLSRLTRDDYDKTTKSITLRDTKGRRRFAYEHVVPLIADARQALDSMGSGQYLFSLDGGETPASYNRVWTLVNAVAQDMVDTDEIGRLFTPGTIRKTVETRLQAVGVNREVRGHLLSHGQSGVQAMHYEAHDYDDEKRDALAKLRRLCDEEGGKVIPLRASSS